MRSADERSPRRAGFVDAADFGLTPDGDGTDNARSLQAALDCGGSVVVSRPGTYEMAGTVFIGSHTSLVCGSGVFLKKVANVEPFTHVLLNKGALTRTYDENICVHGLQIIVNGVDVRNWLVYGLHGQLAFFYVKDLRIERFRCLDLGALQYAIHVCTFEDLIVDDVIIRGDKDGVHLGRGRRFTIRNGVFATYDDAVALNAHDYATGNPEMGWIEDGVVENCHDLSDGRKPVGYFCRILGGAWTDWRPGMEVQHSDIVASNGRLYRVHAKPDGTLYTSRTRPAHDSGIEVIDGIPWVMTQEGVIYTAGVRNVAFRDIRLEKPRTGFSIHFDSDKWSRSYYPGAPVPRQERLLLDHVTVEHDGTSPLVSVATPIDVISIRETAFNAGGIRFSRNSPLPEFGRTIVTMTGCTFRQDGGMELLSNGVDGKAVLLKTTASSVIGDRFRASIEGGNGTIVVESDLPGLTAGIDAERSDCRAQ